MKGNPTLDIVIIGGGPSGVTALKYAVASGLSVQLIEKSSKIGGLWNRVPKWQDIQTPKEDWAINGIAIEGTKSKDIVKYLDRWVEHYQLEPYINLNHCVQGLTYRDGNWLIHCETSEGSSKSISAKNIIITTGLHNIPKIPSKLDMTKATIPYVHSMNLHDLSVFNKDSVTVVGGGASAFDVLELAIKKNVKEINWVTGTLSWMTPSTIDKTKRQGLRQLAFLSLLKKKPDDISKPLDTLTKHKYKKHNVESIMPSGRFDIFKQTSVNPRPLLLQNLERINIHRCHIESLNEDRIKLTDGNELKTEQLVFATGFDMDLNYTKLEKLQNLKRKEELRRRTGCLMKSLDYPNLFFIGPTILDITSTTPQLVSIFTKTILAHIKRKTVIPDRVIDTMLPHWQNLRMLASFDHYNFPRFIWWPWYLALAWYYCKSPTKQVRIR